MLFLCEGWWLEMEDSMSHAEKKCKIIDIQEKTTGSFTGLSQRQTAVEGKTVSWVEMEVYIVNHYNDKPNAVHHMILQLNSCLLRGHQYYHVCCDAIFMINQSRNKIAFITSLKLFVCVLCSHWPSSELFLAEKNILIPSDINMHILWQNSKFPAKDFCLCTMNVIFFLPN